MTRKGGTSQACASCRYQRRRCKSDCPLAPYFPADQPDMFHNAHRLFGVSNITKLLKQIDPNLRGVAMKSIIEEANARAKYPVYGCVAEIQQLMLKIQLAEEELMAVHSQLAFYTQQQQQQQRPDHHHQPDNNPLLPCLQLGTAATVVNPSPPQYAAEAAIPVSHNNPSSYFSAYANTDNSRENSCWVQQLYENGNGGNNSNNNNINNNQMVMMVQQEAEEMGLGNGQRAAPPQEQPITIQVQGNIEDDDYDDMIYPFFDTIDDRQSYIDSKEPYESSSESSFKDIAQSVSENELKNAAACFTLTSINV